ncbi:ATP-binding response regulator [Roseibium sp. Sym1]|uniref:ATP-binding response regulator n=1 Tax=Roseibium sp. Sym1 TaxID=3016006 RepID=UPI0022B54CC5|nr:hybrid sensor histidine kinase/response regulator [Roseibium sp. Sym1]
MADRDEDGVKLALLAHDLRTPLAAMRLTAELIGKGPLNGTQSEQLSILIRSIDALTQMTGDLVAEAGPGTAPEGAPSRVDVVVGEVTDLFQIAANAKGLTLELQVGEGGRDLWTGKSAALRRVLTTLLDNAVKYTATGGVHVELTGYEAGDAEHGDAARARLSVTDSGPGIDPEEGARLFRPFVRGRHGRETGAGSGLGLWGTELLVEDMNGHLTLERPERGGSRFVVDFPVAREGEALPASSGSTPAEQPVSALPPMHVLVVDDNETNCRLLSALLESFGITADVARSGEQAIALAEKGRYDAALLDLHMPEMSGVETAEQLRVFRSERELPLIAVTAALESAGDHRLEEAGFQHMLTKPLSPADLYAAMQLVHRLKRQ